MARRYRRLDEMAATYPTITELVDYGDSYSKTVGGVATPDGQRLAGYDLLAMRITNAAIAGPKPVFVLMAGIHAHATDAVAVMAGESEMAPALAVRRTAAPAAGSPAESTAAAVDLLMATWAAVVQQRASDSATVSGAKIRRPSDKGSDLLSALAGEWMEGKLAPEGHLPRSPARTVTISLSAARLGNPRQAAQVGSDMPLQRSPQGGRVSLVAIPDPVASIVLQ